MSDKDNKKQYNCSESAVIVFVPENTVELKMEVAVYDHGEIKRAEKVLSCDDIMEARWKYLKLDPDDDRFYVWGITEKGIEEYEKIRKQEIS